MLEGKTKGLEKAVVPSSSHMDFYDKDEYGNSAVKEMARFYKPVVG